MQEKSLCGMTPAGIHDLIRPAGFSQSHASSIAKGFYRKKISIIQNIPDIPKKLKDFLAENLLPGISGPETSQVSVDGSVKYLFRSQDGRMFETVFIPEEKRNTVCVSTQSGCRMGCPFCMTSGYGFHGNLSAGEIVNQVISIPSGPVIDHVVFMGMGEPMDNLEEVLKACEILTAEWGLALSPANITVSTVGITTAIHAFLERSRCNLALSLYSPFHDERLRVVPAEKKYPVHGIIELLKNYQLNKKRRITMAYVMIDKENDSDRHLEELRKLFLNSGIRINLLPYHPGSNDHRHSSSAGRMMYFRHSLVMSGISASIRKSRGSDISAACGLLASELKGKSIQLQRPHSEHR